MVNLSCIYPTDSIDLEDDLNILYQKGVESDGNTPELPARKRSMSGQAETGSASKKQRLSADQSDVIEL